MAVDVPRAMIRGMGSGIGLERAAQREQGIPFGPQSEGSDAGLIQLAVQVLHLAFVERVLSRQLGAVFGPLLTAQFLEFLLRVVIPEGGVRDAEHRFAAPLYRCRQDQNPCGPQETT